MRNITFNGVNYSLPDTGESGWGTTVTDYLQAISTGALSKGGGLFPLAGEVDFGPSFGIKSLYFRSRSAQPALTGAIRLSNADSITFRSAENTADLQLKLDGTNRLTFNGSVLNYSGSYSAADTSFTPFGYVTSENVQNALQEVITRSTSATTLPFTPTGYVANTNVQGALNTIITRTTTAGNIPKVSYGWDTLTNVEESINAIIDRTTSSMSYPFSPYSIITATNVQQAVQQAVDYEVSTRGTLTTHTGSTAAHGATGAVVGTTNTQTLTNKTISGSANTITNIPNTALTGASVMPLPDTLVLRDASGIIINNQIQGNAIGGPLALKGIQTDGAAAVGVAFDTNQPYTVAGSKLISVRNNGVEKVYVDGATGAIVQSSAGSGVESIIVPQASRLSLSGPAGARYLYADSTYVRSDSPIKTSGNVEAAGIIAPQFTGTSTTVANIYSSPINSTSTSVAHQFQTVNSQAVAGSKLMTVANNFTEKWAIDKDGVTLTPEVKANNSGTLTLRGAQAAGSASTDVVVDTSATRTAAKLFSVRNNGSEKYYVDINGNVGLGNLSIFTAAGASGNVTVNARNGTAIIPVGATSVVVTNSLVLGANATIWACISDTTANGTLTNVHRISAAAGSFTLYGNAAATTAVVNVKWSILYNGG